MKSYTDLSQSKKLYEISNSGQDSIKMSRLQPKFKVGDIISNGKIVYRVDGITKNCLGSYCYSLVDVESEKKGIRYLTMYDSKGNTYHMGKTSWICEQVDAEFEKQGEQKDSWSEEDKKKFNRIYMLLAEAADEHAFSTTHRLIGDKECVDLQDFLKSLKDRLQPQNQAESDETKAKIPYK